MELWSVSALHATTIAVFLAAVLALAANLLRAKRARWRRNHYLLTACIAAYLSGVLVGGGSSLIYDIFDSENDS